MELLRLTQGSIEWLERRLGAFTASEAPIMMGASSHMSRDELLAYKKTRIEEEINNYTQRVYDLGHELEDMARPIAEKIVGADLYPVTGAIEIGGQEFLASFDGLDMLQRHGFEHKQWNALKADKMMGSNEPLPEYYWQLEHQLLVSEAESILFMMSDGTENQMIALQYRSHPDRRKLLLEGWSQFSKDLENYVPKSYTPEPEGVAPGKLPSLDIRLIGEVKSSNLELYEDSAMKFIKSISTDLSSDEDFATAEKTIKFCDAAEKELELVKAQALSQTADISKLFNTVDTLKSAMRDKRLELNKLVESRKRAIRQKIVLDRKQQFDVHVNQLNEQLKQVVLPVFDVDFASAIKGKKTIKSLEESANEMLSQAKVTATMTAQDYQNNLETLNDLCASEYLPLFQDLQQIIGKDPDDFELLVTSRIEKFEKDQSSRLKAGKEQHKEESQPDRNCTDDSNLSASSAFGSSMKMLATNEVVDLRLYLVKIHSLTDEQAFALSNAIEAGDVPHVRLVSEQKEKAA